MRNLNEIKGYATQQTAIAAASKVIDLDTVRWVMTVTEAGRFIVTVGVADIDLVHTGKVAVFG